MIAKNALERLFANKFYGYNRVTGNRNPLVDITLNELLSKINAKFVETRYLGREYNGRKVYLTVVRHRSGGEWRGYVTALSSDESLYTIYVDKRVDCPTKRDIEKQVIVLKREIKQRGYVPI